jgi:Flp pilus assembly protein TadG
VAFMAAISVISALVATAQPKPAVRRRSLTARRQQDAPKQGTIQFGDVQLSNFKNLSVNYASGLAKIDGANSTVDTVDANIPGAKTRLQASQFVVYLSPKNVQQVERVEAIGNMRYTSTRPVTGGGVMLLRGTGSKGTYFKQEGRRRVDGPVNFYGEAPTADGKAKQTATGTAPLATYDQNKQLLTLSGGVNLTLILPGFAMGELPVHGDTIAIDMSSRPYNYNITNQEPGEGNIRFRPAPPKTDQKPDQKLIPKPEQKKSQ